MKHAYENFEKQSAGHDCGGARLGRAGHRRHGGDESERLRAVRIACIAKDLRTDALRSWTALVQQGSGA